MHPRPIHHVPFADGGQRLRRQQYATRSNASNTRCIGELQRKVHMLRNEANILSSHLTLLERETRRMTAENDELKQCLQTVEQEHQFLYTINEELIKETGLLKEVTDKDLGNFAAFGSKKQQAVAGTGGHEHAARSSLATPGSVLTTCEED